MKIRKLKMEEVAVTRLLPHPKNHEIFPSNDREQEALTRDVAVNGIQVPIVINAVNLHGEYGGEGMAIVLSGHRRLYAARALGIERVVCDVREIHSPTYELMLLCSLNVGRGFKDSHKIRLYKGAKQFLCQLRENPDLLRDSGSDNPDIEALVHIVDARIGKIKKGTRTHEIVEALFGIGKREQEPLTWLCDEEYREKYLGELPVSKKEKARLLTAWAELEKSALNEEISLKDAVKTVEKFRKQCKALAEGKVKPVKPMPVAKLKPQPEIFDAETLRSKYVVEEDEVPAFGFYYMGDAESDSRLIIPNAERTQYAALTIQDLFLFVGFPLTN